MAEPRTLTPDAASLSGAVVVRAEHVEDAETIDRIVLEAFGPGRFAKTAERLREGASIAVGFVACLDSRVVGSVRLWRIRVDETPCLFLGPIAVERSERSEGLGAALVKACIDHTRATDSALGPLMAISVPRTWMSVLGNASSTSRNSWSRWPRRPTIRWFPGTLTVTWLGTD